MHPLVPTLQRVLKSQVSTCTNYVGLFCWVIERGIFPEHPPSGRCKPPKRVLQSSTFPHPETTLAAFLCVSAVNQRHAQTDEKLLTSNVPWHPMTMSPQNVAQNYEHPYLLPFNTCCIMPNTKSANFLPIQSHDSFTWDAREVMCRSSGIPLQLECWFAGPPGSGPSFCSFADHKAQATYDLHLMQKPMVHVGAANVEGSF